MTDDGTVVFCPACGARYTIGPELLIGDGLRVLCGTCGGGFAASEVAAQAPSDEVAAAGESAATVALPRVVIGHEVPSATRTIARVLRGGGYAPVPVRTGDQVLQAIDPALPAPVDGVVLDVGVPGVLAFEVIDQIRSHPSTKGLPVVLLASVFERTRYKRRPNRLYGADAYLELHHVPDRLCSIIDALRGSEPIPDERVQAPADRARAAALRAEVSTLDGEGLRILARRLLSDMALYHGDEVARGVAAGDPLGQVPEAVEAARQLFLDVSPDTPGVFAEELDDFVARLNERDRVRRKADG
jgi:predicted Zn finger-like uncharacterized protein